MKINELIEKVIAGESLEELIQIQDFIPAIDKKSIATEVLENCTNEIDGYIHVDEFKKSIYFALATVREYTNFEPDFTSFEAMLVDYDTLCQFGILSAIIAVIGDDYLRTEHVLAGEQASFTASNSIEAQIAKLAIIATDAIGKLTNMINDKIGNADLNNILPEGTNVEELLGQLAKFK